MFLSLAFLFTASAPNLAELNNGENGVHTPHSVTSSVAFGKRPNGDVEMVLISREDARVMSSMDGGFSYQPIAGDGLGKVNAHRAVFYEVPATGEGWFVVATDNGIWKYVPTTGAVAEMSTGLDANDRYITDLAAPLPGQDGPVVAVNSDGQVYLLDEGTETWNESIDLAKFDQNAVCAIAPEFDRAAAAGPARTIMVGARGLLLVSEDGGTTWTNHAQFDVVANDIFEMHVTALEFDRDYANNGLVLLGRGRRDLVNPFESEGDLWRSADYGATFSAVSILGSTTLSSGVHALEHGGTGPDAADHWFAAVYRFPEHDDLNAGYDVIGVLHSTDGGLTWDDQGSFQEFIQEFSGNEKVAVGLPYRRMMQISVSPDFATDGELWLARSEGLYESDDQGVTWAKRRFRPSTQVRGISTGFNHRGEVVTYGATYGSGIYRFNHTTGQADTLIDSGVMFFASMASSPNSDVDGIAFGGGQRDLMIRFAEPNPPGQQGWYSVNAIREALDGNTGYVRTIALDPDFGGFSVPGANQVFAWSSRFEDTPLGESRITLDGLNNVYTLNALEAQAGQRAPYMHEMDIAKSFDHVALPQELDIFGVSSAPTFNQVYRLRNNGTPGAPVFEWAALNASFEGLLIDVEADPRFDRSAGFTDLWVLSSDKLYRIEDESSDWSQFRTVSYDGIEDYLVVDMKLSADMDLRPAVYVATWGGGVFKLDLTQQNPTWESLGGAPPDAWGECLELSPDFENDRLIFVGTQRGLYHIEDRPGASWVRVNNEVLYDSQNTSFDFYSPNDPTNPDPSRPWGWTDLKTEFIPQNILDNIAILGDAMLASQYEGDFAEFTAKAESKISVLSFRGPMMGVARVIAWDPTSGSASAPFHDVTVDLHAPGVSNYEFEVVLPQPGVYTVRIEGVTLPNNKYLMVDGIRLTD